MKIMKAILLASAIVSTSALAITPEQQLQNDLNDGIQYCDSFSGMMIDINNMRYEGNTMNETIADLTGVYSEQLPFNQAVQMVYTTFPKLTNKWTIDLQTNRLAADVYDKCMEQINALYLIDKQNLENRRGQ